MDVSFGCRLAYQFPAATPVLFNLEAARDGRQRLASERLILTPDVPTERWTMPESGNRYLRVVAGPGPFRLEYEGSATLGPALEDPAAIGEVPPGALPFEVYPHLWPSRYCQSDRLERFARREFGDAPPGHARVRAICDWIHQGVDYASGTSDESLSAMDILAQRAGVCRDFAHLAIALCRAMGIPARYVSADAWRLDPPDFHAVVEAWLQGPGGGGWYPFDPTHLAPPEGILRIGIGRDAAEVAFAAPLGPFEAEKPEVWIAAAEDAGRPATGQAVRSRDRP